jgi:hypothetical protein
MHRIKSDDGPAIDIRVRRDNIFEDSFEAIFNLDEYTLTRRLNIKYEGEIGLDYVE